MAAKAQSFTGLRSSGGSRTLTFGLVRVEVGSQPAFESATRRKGEMLCPDDGLKLNQFYRDEAGHEHTALSAVKGYTLDNGETVIMERDELDAIKNAVEDTDVALEARVPLTDVPVEFYTGTPSLLFPKSVKDAEGYKLIAAALRDSDTALVGSAVDHGTTKGYIVRWSHRFEVLVAHTLNYDANVRHSSIEAIQSALVKVDDPSDEMIGMAEQVFGSLPDSFEFDSLHDTYGETLEAALLQKAQGKTITMPATPVKVAEPPDLMAALKASVGEAEAKKKKAPAAKKQAKEKATVH